MWLEHFIGLVLIRLYSFILCINLISDILFSSVLINLIYDQNFGQHFFISYLIIIKIFLLIYNNSSFDNLISFIEDQLSSSILILLQYKLIFYKQIFISILSDSPPPNKILFLIKYSLSLFAYFVSIQTIV